MKRVKQRGKKWVVEKRKGLFQWVVIGSFESKLKAEKFARGQFN